jgi:hypothetical protein
MMPAIVSQSGMSSTWIVEAVDVSAKGQFGGGAGLEDGSPDQLTLDRLERAGSANSDSRINA